MVMAPHILREIECLWPKITMKQQHGMEGYMENVRTSRKDTGLTFFGFSASGDGKWSFLNNTIGVFEYYAEGDGTVKGTIWEWK